MSLKLKLSFLLLSVFIVKLCFAQSQDEGWFPFPITPLNTNEVEFAPKFPVNPIGDDDFVSVNADGHFEVNGEEIRFWGSPIYPFKSDKNLVHSEVVELRKMGVNMVRFHLIDSRAWSESDIFGSYEGTRTLDPVQLDKMDFMVSQLKQQGIYIYMDLLCDRHYTESDGVEHPDSVMNAAKEVNFFDPVLIELQKEYANQLLSHVNPYTGLALKDDPVMACMEVVNEGWFLHSVRCDGMKPQSEGGSLSWYHYNMLTDLWNDFLVEKYESHANLMSAWGLKEPTAITLENNGFESDLENWDYGAYGDVQATLETSTESHSGSKAFHINVTQTSELNYECYLQHQSLPFEAGKSYTMRFWAKSDQENTIQLNVAQTVEPWTSLGYKDFQISNEWKEYTFTFYADQVWENDPHFMFNLGWVSGNLWIDNVSIYEGMKEISDGGSLDDKSIKLLSVWQDNTEPNRQRQLDQSEFYLKLQTDHFNDIKSYLENDLNVRIPITGSNFITGIADVFVNSGMDFTDAHGYWGLMSPNKTSMLESPHFANAMTDMFAGIGVAGKPLASSEYNYEMPNAYANEALFFLTAYSSFQNADMALVHGTAYEPLYNGIMYNSLGNYNRLFDKAMYASMGYVYRHHLISGASETVTMGFTNEDVKNLVFHSGDLWETGSWPNDYPFEMMYQHGLRSSFGAEQSYDRNDYPATPSSPYISDTDEIEWDDTGLLSINAPQFLGIVGKMHQFKNKEIGPLKIIDADKSCGLTILSLDGKDIPESEKMLMTFTTQQGTEGMVIVNGSVTDHGNGPILLEPAQIEFQLNTAASEVKVTWLDGDGNPSDYYEVFSANEEGVATISINTYENPGLWFGVEQDVGIEEKVSVTFQVVMQNETVAPEGVFLCGTFNGWESSTPLDVNGSVYSTTLEFTAGDQIEYKFVNGSTWEEIGTGSCTTGEYSNRTYSVPDSDASIDLCCFNSCSACSVTAVAEESLGKVTVYPNPIKNVLNISGLKVGKNVVISLYSVGGQVVKSVENNGQEKLTLDMGSLNQGVYLLMLTSESETETFRIVKKTD